MSSAPSVSNGDDQEEVIEAMRITCLEKMLEEELQKDSAEELDDLQLRCPSIWDGILCWGEAAAGETVTTPCPNYIAGFDITGEATRQCLDSGDWYSRPEEPNATWTNYSQCIPPDPLSTLVIIPQLEGNVSLIAQWIPLVKAIARVGYSVSLGTIIVAFVIMASIKKLRCPRNLLHMHLFASFMMRAFMSLLKDSLFVGGLGLSSDVIVQNGETFVKTEGGHSWECKMVVSLWQFFIMANYSWVLMEGLYLHNLIFLALFSDTSSITLYVILGWGLPVLVVGPWVVLRAILENTHCWTTNDNSLFFLVIRIPIVTSILINFLLFLNIVRVLLLKLKSSISEETRKYRYRRWAKSTLVLVPLFGVHYTLFLGMSYSIGVNQAVEIIWLFCDQFFASFQGSFVAILYCFMNGEVRAELSKIWHHCKRGSVRGGRTQWWLSSGYTDGSSSRRTSKAGGALVTFPRKSRDAIEDNKKITSSGGGTDSDQKYSRTSSKSLIVEMPPAQAMRFPRLGRQMSPTAEAGKSATTIGRLRGCWILKRNRGKVTRGGVSLSGKGKGRESKDATSRTWRIRLGIGPARHGKRNGTSSPCTTSYSCQTTRCSLDSGVVTGLKEGRAGDEHESHLWPPLLAVHDEQETPPLLHQEPSRGKDRYRGPVKKDTSDGIPLKNVCRNGISEDWKSEIDAISYMDNKKNHVR